MKKILIGFLTGISVVGAVYFMYDNSVFEQEEKETTQDENLQGSEMLVNKLHVAAVSKGYTGTDSDLSQDIIDGKILLRFVNKDIEWKTNSIITGVNVSDTTNTSTLSSQWSLLVSYEDNEDLYAEITESELVSYIKQYYMVFFVTNSSEIIEPQVVEEGSSIVLPTLTGKDGYMFTGWYNTESSWESFDNIVLYSVTLEAKWAEAVSVITYDVNGGDALENRFDKVSYKDNLTMPTPQRDGYTFGGWYNGTDLIENGIWEIYGDVELVAKWDIARYTITYNNVNGAISNNPLSYSLEEDNIRLESPTKAGCEFIGWFTDPSFTKEITIIDTSLGTNIELYAKWNLTEYTIVYNNVEDAVNNNPLTYTAEYSSVSLLDPTKEGYEFDGWYIDSLFVNEITSINTSNLSDLVLYAKWNLTEYTITYLNVDDAINNNSLTYTINDGIISLSNPTKEGYDFNGWYTDELFVNQVTTIDSSLATNIVLYACFEEEGQLDDEQLALLSHYQAVIDKNKKMVGLYTSSTSYSSFFKLNAGSSGYVEGVTSLDFVEHLDVSEVTTMEYAFVGCSLVTSLNLKRWDVSKVVTMKHMFSRFSTLTELKGIENWDVSNVETMMSMFTYCNSLESIDITAWDVSNLNSMFWMFGYCTSLKTFDFGDLDVSNVTTMYSMFAYCYSLESINFQNIDTTGLTTIVGMFSNCTSLKYIDLSNMDFSNVTTAASMFENCISLTNIKITNSDFSSVGTLFFGFASCGVVDLDLSGSDFSSVTTMESAFSGNTTIETINMSGVIINSLTTMSETFKGCTSLETLNMTGFNTSNVTTMASMFYNCSNLTSITGIFGWNVSNLKTKTNMFYNCNQTIIPYWY